jgi:hypothetical protein
MREKFKVVILTDDMRTNAVKAKEIVTILRKLADRIEETGDIGERYLYDTTGNKVGTSGETREY